MVLGVLPQSRAFRAKKCWALAQEGSYGFTGLIAMTSGDWEGWVCWKSGQMVEREFCTSLAVCYTSIWKHTKLHKAHHCYFSNIELWQTILKRKHYLRLHSLRLHLATELDSQLALTVAPCRGALIADLVGLDVFRAKQSLIVYLTTSSFVVAASLHWPGKSVIWNRSASLLLL